MLKEDVGKNLITLHKNYRVLYNFFDYHKIRISVVYERGDENSYFYYLIDFDVDVPEIERYPEGGRDNVEYLAFNEAFELLEQQL